MLFFVSWRSLWLRDPGRPRKNLHVCVLTLAGSVSGHEAFTKPAGRWLAGFQATPTLGIKTQTCGIFACGQTQRQTQLALEGADASAEHHAPKRPQHPAHRTPSACSIRPIAPKRLQPSPEHTRLPSHCTPDSPSLPHNASLGSLAWPLLHIMHQAPTRQLPAMPAIRTPSAHSPPRICTSGAHGFPLMGTSVAHDPSRICALDVHGFSCAAQCAPSAPTFLAGLRFSTRCRASACRIRKASRRSSGRASTRAFSRWPNPHPPRPLPHRSRR